MSESMLNENLISTLEQSLRQTRNAQSRLLTRLREVESEAERLRQEIEALENSAEQTEQAIYSLLATIRSGKQTRNLINSLRVDDDYEIPAEVQRAARRNSHMQDSIRRNEQNERGGGGGGGNNRRYANESYQDNQVAYINNKYNNNSNRGVPSINENIEPISQRFADRTITQACTLLLRESGQPLHVNELYNLLVAGGFEFKGNNPTISIAVSLNRNRRFRKIAPSTFDLVIRDASQAAS